uniref:Uncharacterized protein n=1 Tax=Anopheles merus TaxID=30066 RepID=A0A182VNH6_ANOME
MFLSDQPAPYPPCWSYVCLDLKNAITFAMASPMLIIRIDTPTNSVLRLIATRKASSVFITPRKNITGTIIACSRLIRPNTMTRRGHVLKMSSYRQAIKKFNNKCTRNINWNVNFPCYP